jgi:hypothetical protein
MRASFKAGACAALAIAAAIMCLPTSQAQNSPR